MNRQTIVFIYYIDCNLDKLNQTATRPRITDSYLLANDMFIVLFIVSH